MKLNLVNLLKIYFFANTFVTINSFYKNIHVKKISYLKIVEKQIPITELINNIEKHNVYTIYFSNDLTKIYSYSENIKQIANSNPILTSNIIDISYKNNVNAIILDIEKNIFNSLPYLINNFFDIFFIGLMVSFILRNIYFYFNRQNIPLGRNNVFPPFIKNNNFVKNLNISLSSWAGSPEVLDECIEIVSYLKNSTNYKNVGAEIPKGILLEGPPGTGKTLIAKAIASETNANFISISASEFVEVFVGVGASKVRNLFKQARENAPSIIFIDEIDAIGKQRSAGLNIGNDEREQTLNQILSEMDGFNSNENVIVIGATNRKDILDSALLRPGRFDRIVYVPLPDRSSRISILNLYLKNKKIEDNINIFLLAELTAGFSGAQINNLINEGAINAARNGEIIISQKNIEDALEKIIIGITKKIDLRKDEIKRRVAIHEIGHAFLASYFDQYFQLKKVTIKPTYSGIGGYTIFNEYPEITDSGLFTKDLLNKRLIVALGGKASEEIFYGKEFVSLGANQDLKQANSIAQKMICNYGMGEDLKVFYDESVDSGKISDKRKEKIDNESLLLLDNAYKEAIEILENNKDKINLFVSKLLQNITLDGDYFYKI